MAPQSRDGPEDLDDRTRAPQGFGDRGRALGEEAPGVTTRPPIGQPTRGGEPGVGISKHGTAIFLMILDLSPF
jgi:hypothetical protein